METAAQSETGQANGAAHQLPLTGKSGFQKRIDRLTKEKFDLKAEISQLQGDLQRAVLLIEKYKVALRRARRVNAE